MEAFESLNTQDKSERLTAATGHLLRGRLLLAVFVTIGDADTPWHPQVLNPVTFESQRLTKDSPMVYPSHALRHGDVRTGEPCDTLRFSSRFY